MKKLIKLLFVAMLSISFISAQLPTIEGNFLSAPSVGSLSSYVKTPVSISSGVPDTNIPFFSLPTHNKNIFINCGMSYHPNNSGRYNKASDLGLGWSTYGLTALVYQNINPYNGFPEGDIYYYNIFGRSGKFSLTKNSSGGIVLSKITYDKLVIKATEPNNQYNFTITDEMGNTFFFTILDISYVYYDGNPKTFTTGYYLSKVVDVNGLELLNIEYQEDNYTVNPPGMPGIQKPVKNLKAKKVIAHDYGEINLNYSFDAGKRKSYSDPFQLESIELKTPAGRTVQKFGFQSGMSGYTYPYGYIPVPSTPCLYTETQNKRMLNKVLKYNTSLTGYQTTEFSYNPYKFDNIYWTDAVNPNKPCFENEAENPIYLGLGLLSSVKFSTGATVKYEYEPNQYYVDKNTTFYLDFHAPPHTLKDRETQYYEDVAAIDFDTNQGTNLIFDIPVNPDNTEGSSYLEYWVNVDEYYDNPILEEGGDPFVNAEITSAILVSEGYKKYMPGDNTLAITGTGGKGTIIIKRIRYKSKPLPNYSTGKGVRIKKIEYYDGSTLVPSQTKIYDYQKFIDDTKTSGFLNEYDDAGVAYKNVKETIGINGGYTKYYFKTLDDYPENLKSDGTLKYLDDLNYFNVLMNGIADKVEIYDKNDVMITRESNDYEFHLPNPNIVNDAMIKKHFTTVSNYMGSEVITINSETVRDQKDFNVIYKKTTESDGTINEQNITYPWGIFSTNPRLWNGGVKAVPLVVENKRNGKVLSKTETKYENTSHFYPTSQVSYLPDTLSQSIKNMSFDIYDDKGNPVQYTAFPEVGSTGTPTTIIWGYNKTMPIAKIEGAKLSDVPSSLITAIVNASNNDANASEAQEEILEKTLVDALNTFKNDAALQNFMVTCYTYNPLIGTTTVIPPNGMMEFYKYDVYNRLQKVIDVNGNTVKEHQYNYKN
ncbi:MULTISPECIES: hypothetical protein [Chryseobacterium]|uniref:YD repeat-containing protein n=1 Tax=Chryseobacterium geocarposphaerae TaxID=1416776 RepID=A0ABU1LGM5_9FLAO|nr:MULTISPECIES: hypothetical protein [Chryseobacterium]MDR6405877.1 hypothetical protein [Chryseobacterium geocarposphaerae]MDR6698959.1 hypothetical protein [Chryseobacterium ginsenosidimutans]